MEEKEAEIIVPFIRTVEKSCRKLPYRKRTGEFKKPLHWGQRKLLLGEIEFLTQYGKRSDTIIYAGAADGKHIIYLSKLFPNHHFILYDPLKLDPGLYGLPNIEIKQQLFTDEDAELYKNKDVILISDIRNMPEGYNKDLTPEESDDLQDDVESNVKLDMEMQKKWHEIINPAAAFLKFRLPYTSGNTEYLIGDLKFQPWAPPTSTETRLTTLREYNQKTQTYDHKDYESILYRFNRCTRIQLFKEFFSARNIPNIGIFESYDLATEIDILSEYIQIVEDRHEYVGKRVVEMIEEIHQYLGKNFQQKYYEKKEHFNFKIQKIKKIQKIDNFSNFLSHKMDKFNNDRHSFGQGFIKNNRESREAAAWNNSEDDDKFGW